MEQTKLQSALNDLCASPRVNVAFVLNQQGGLLAWSGESAAFSPTGQFTPRAQGQERDDNLYITVIEDHYLGVIFKEGESIDTVRTEVESHESNFKQHLG